MYWSAICRALTASDDPRAVLIRHQYVFALLWNSRYREAAAVQRVTSQIADRVGDARSKAYSLAGEIHASTLTAPRSLGEFEILKREAIRAASETADAYIQNWTRWVVGLEDFHRGRMTDAQDSAHELMRVGRLLNDPRSTGQGLNLLAWIALVSDSYAQALEYSEQSLAVALTPFERTGAVTVKGCALVLLRRIEEGATLLEQHRRLCVADGNLFTVAGSDAAIGICRVMQGNISGGIRFIEDAISQREKEGYRDAADWYRLFLCEAYLQIIVRNEKLPVLTLLKNLSVLLKAMLIGPSRIRALLTVFLENPHLDPVGLHVGRAKLILGLLYKAKKKRALALHLLAEAQRILSQFGQSPILARVDAALAELK